MTLDAKLLQTAEAARARLLDLEHESDRARVDFHHGLRRLHAAGGSLREIAEHFGLSHQRVHQIVDGADAGRRRAGGVLERVKDRVRDWGPFTRFTKDAQEVVRDAHDEARDLGHEQVGSEHLLLALLAGEGSVAARVLAALGVERSAVSDEIVRAVGRGEADAKRLNRPFTARAKKVLELSLREALALKHDHIGTEHILLGLTRDSGLAGRIMRDLGADPARVRAATLRALDGAAQ
jgi:ClpA/ClpB-like protein